MMDAGRVTMYRLLSRLFKSEVDGRLFHALSKMEFPENAEGELAQGYQLWNDYFVNVCRAEITEEIAVDFARIFLAAGVAKGEAAFPYESVYTSKQRLVMQNAWEQVRAAYAEKGVAFESSDEGILEDHLGCELEFMAYLCEQTEDGIAGQLEFAKAHLLNWIDPFAGDLSRFASTGFYRGLAKVLCGFVKQDLEQLSEQNKRDEQKNSLGETGYELSAERMDEIMQTLSENFVIYAPKCFHTGAGANTETVKYVRVSRYSDIVFDRQSDFSPKESYYPVSQTLFFFTESEVIESSVKEEKDILIFARPCDINAMRRLDNIFLRNGEPDFYYERLRKKVHVAMIECRESFEYCFCVSLGTNVTDAYDLAVRAERDRVYVQVKNQDFDKYLTGGKTVEFKPEFVQSNKRVLKIPQISDRENLKWVSSHSFWEQFDEDCIGCGGCNTVCGTCSCFDTVDITYNESGQEGERRRVWSSCMLEDFTRTAGGARARKTPGANMRFKVLHKFYDYKARFGEDHMCVGCGRCTKRCPQDIDFFGAVNSLAELIEREYRPVGKEERNDG